MSTEINLKSAVEEVLDDFSEDVFEAVTESIEEVADYAVRELQSTSPRRKGKGGGKYARSWDKKTVNHRLRTECVVYNKKHYRLTHLLENGHATANGTGRCKGDTPAHPHIGRINDAVQKKVVEEIERRLSH